MVLFLDEPIHVMTYPYCMQLEACAHPFFDELRDPNTRLPNGRPLPPLFKLSLKS